MFCSHSPGAVEYLANMLPLMRASSMHMSVSPEVSINLTATAPVLSSLCAMKATRFLFCTNSTNLNFALSDHMLPVGSMSEKYRKEGR